MVEALLYVSLGAFVATLLWLLFLPLFWGRAVRLTTRSLIDRLPVSRDEIIASHDRMRAAQAMAMRGVERRAETALAEAAEERIDAARARATELGHLATTSELRARVADLEAESQRLRADLERAIADATARAAALEAAQEAIKSAASDLEAARLDAAAARNATEQARIESSAREQEIEALRADLEAVRAPSGAGVARASREDLAVLRIRIDEVADAIVKAAENEASATVSMRARTMGAPQGERERARLTPSTPERAGAH